MSKITSVKNENRVIVSNKITRPEAVIEWELKLINSHTIRQCLPIKVSERRRVVILETEYYSSYNLFHYFNGLIGRQMFLNFVLRMIEIIKKCEEHKLNPSNLLLDYEYIFVEPRNEQVSCIYWPIVNNKNQVSIPSFFRQLPEDFALYRTSGNDYLFEYESYFEMVNPFSLKSFEKMVLRLLGKELQTQADLFYGSEESRNHVIIEREKQKEVSISYNPILVSDFSRMEPKSKSQDSVVSEIAVSIPDETNVLIHTSLESEKENRRKMVSLQRQNKGEQIMITQPEFVIGRSKKFCNYVIMDNTAISRSHIVIHQDISGKVLVSDNSSSNGTKLNDMKLVPEMSYELHNGDILMLADESFTVVIKQDNRQ